MYIVERLISLVSPHSCVGCGNEGVLLCDWCKVDALHRLPQRCYSCHAHKVDSSTCAKCRRFGGPMNVWVASEYEGLTKALITKLKFGRARAAAKLCAEMLDEIVPHLEPATVIVHIPTATSRRRSRGYDQSECIAKEFALLRELKFASLLARRGQTRQVGANKKQRKKQMENVFRVAEIKRNVPVVLVDDLLTTGATVESATKSLKKAGVKKVFAAVVAQRSV